MYEAAIIAGLRGAGLIGAATPVLEPLSGGVSCDVWRVETSNGAIVVKRALEKLRVAADWHAPVDRGASEVRWLRYARAIDARLAPEVLAEMPGEHAFAMRFVPGMPVWKDELIAGRVDAGFAASVGRDLARIHAASAHRPRVAAEFRTDALFAALRIDPFLHYVAARDASAAAPLTVLADRLAATKVALVHGDVSPKNILVGGDGPVFLDAECAVYGDPAFDLAFCTTHLLLKRVWLKNPAFDHAAAALVAVYRNGVDWEPVEDLSVRAGELTAALLLARVEGKSPAPYLTDAADRAIVRDHARRLLGSPQPIDRLVANWKVPA